jgi:hypothetical protein
MKNRISEMRFEKTAHFIERQRKRGITDVLIALTIAWGEKFYQGSECVYFLGHRHLQYALQKRKMQLSDQEIQRAEGTVVVVGIDNCLITAYRNPRYIRHLRRCA